MKGVKVLMLVSMLLILTATVYSEEQTIAWSIGDSGDYLEGDYTGQLQDGIPHGQGRFQHMWTPQTYVGQWEEGKRHGIGSFFAFPPEDGGYLLYEGEWAECMRHGEGTAYRHDQTVAFSGRWVQGQPDE